MESCKLSQNISHSGPKAVMEGRQTKLFDEYDLNKLQKAKKLVTEVYEYNYGAPYSGKELKKMETIIRKLDALIGNPQSLQAKS